jgi:hypothetical protein
MKNFKFRTKTMVMLVTLTGLIATFSCKKKEESKPAAPVVETPVPTGPNTISGNITSASFVAGTTYQVTGDLKVPAGTTVTIPAGVTLEFQEGANGEAWFLEVNGSLHIMGEETRRVRLVPSAALLASSKNQGVGGLWGGIIGTNVAGDLIIQYADILHAGGAVREENEMAKPSTGGSGELEAGDASYGLYYVREIGKRQDGIFVLRHSKVAFTQDDAIRINGGKVLFSHNVFEVTGSTGGDAVNIKAGVTGDFAFNMFYNLATNGLKAADNSGSGVRGITDCNFYNNTIVNSGYRRAEPGRGAGLNYETKAGGECYNNLLVNNRFGLRLVSGQNEPDVTKLSYGYNWNYGSVKAITDEFYPTANTASKGLIGTDARTPIPTTDKAGGPGENDPLFVNFDPSTFVFGGGSVIATDPLRRNISPMPAGSDFRLKSTSPALTGGKTDFSPVHASYASLDGTVTFTTPAPAVFFGAYGSN